MTNVDLTTKVLCLKASAHFLIISNLFFILTLLISGAAIYNYLNCPKEFMGKPYQEEMLNAMKDGVIMKTLGGFTALPFFALSFLSGFISCFKYKEWFGFCALISLGMAFLFTGYNAVVLLFLKLKYVWPPYLIGEVQTEIPNLPITAEYITVHFTKVLITVVTFAMFAAISILLYCTFVLVNLSFLYKTPKRFPKRRVPIKQLEEEEEEDEDEVEEDEKGGEEKKSEKKKSEEKKTVGSKEKSESGGTKNKTIAKSPTGASPVADKSQFR